MKQWPRKPQTEPGFLQPSLSSFSGGDSLILSDTPESPYNRKSSFAVTVLLC